MSWRFCVLKTLVKEVVNQLGLYITYKDEDEFPAKGLYKTSPVQVSLTPQEAEKLNVPMMVEMTLQPGREYGCECDCG